ncbi:hypothetical protein F4810DRAFT_712477 [Camillea tinctor]|nr:hypothetical protein F4810DRAFT_712477 [Camillea tinctor]
MTSTPWTLLVFRVDTTTPDSRTDTLYANGRKQIELIDYDAPTTELADGWSYSANRNDVFVNTKKYMVSTTRVENKRIGARVKLPDGTMVTTTTSPYNFYVTLEGTPPVVYATDNITVARVTVNKGEKEVDTYIDIETKIGSTRMPWSQDNYYISSNVHDFVKADIYDYDPTGHEQGHEGDMRLANLFNYWWDNGKLRLSFIWEFATQSTKTVGLYRESRMSGIYTNEIHASEDIEVNQKSNALCLTRMAFDIGDDIWGDNWSNSNCGFTIYDHYGNTGQFHASWSEDKDAIVITDSNL